MSIALNASLSYEACQCSECAIRFLVPEAWRKERHADHRNFYCPNGHSQYYPQKSEAEVLREELDRTRKDLGARLSEANERANKAESEAKRVRQRVRGGVCPCCKRNFHALRRHMASKHPEYRAT
jgi:hypothetical protein